MSRRDSELHGVLIVDKPRGLTSHDVVQRVRRLARTSRVGHAGTLDPLATGVLVVMVGEGTKLGPYLTCERKSYRTEGLLGKGTDTLDAEGTVVAEGALPAGWCEAPERALAAAVELERRRLEQVPPAFSAIKVGGTSAHALARRGEEVVLAPRAVSVASLEVTFADPDGRFGLVLEVSKGYYVRSLVRDLGVTLGCPAHLTALRREASGSFTLDGALTLADVEAEPARLGEWLLAVPVAAARALPVGRLTQEGEARARQGKRLGGSDFDDEPRSEAPTAWLAPDGALVAVGRRGEAGHVVLRGFR